MDNSRENAGTKAAKTRAEKYAKASPEEKARIDETRHQAAIKANEERKSLEYFVKKFKKNRQSFDLVRKSIEEIEQIRKNFLKEFSKEKIEQMTLEEYADGYVDSVTGKRKEDSFSCKIARLAPFGSIENPSGMYTHEIFIRSKTQEPDYDKTKYSSTEDAFGSTKNSIIKLLEAGENYDLDAIEKIDLHSLLKSKILSVYFTNKFLNIHSKTALIRIATDLEIGSEPEIKKKTLFQIEKLLLNYKNEKESLKDLYIPDYGHILWSFYEKGAPSRKKQIKRISEYLDQLSKYNIPTTHLQVLKKFYRFSGKYLSASKIYGSWNEGEAGKKSPVEPDEIVDEPHYMHNLVKGVYKPKNDAYAQSIMLNPKSKWELEIDRETPILKINYDFGEYEKYKEQIEPMKKCHEDGIPIGILFRTLKGRYKCLGLGEIVSQTNEKFIIESFGISDEESSILKNETISEFETSLQDPELIKINDISYADFLDSIDFHKEFRLETLNPDSSPKTWPAKISQIIENCESGEWSLPDFQRYFDWDKEMIRKFLLSIFSGFYVGSLLLWKAGNNDRLGTMPIEGITLRKEDLKTNEIILDGQQRITSLYYAIKSPDYSLAGDGKNQRRYYYIDFGEFFRDPESEDILKVFFEKVDEDYSYKKLLFPFSKISKHQDWVRNLRAYLKDNNPELDFEKIVSMCDAISEKLRYIYHDYQIPYVLLSENMTLEQVTEIFERINTSGKQLDNFDLLIARLSAYDIKLRELWNETKAEHPKLQEYFEGSRRSKGLYIMQTIALCFTQSKSCKRKDILDIFKHSSSNKEDFEEKWKMMAKYTSNAIDMLEDTRDGFGVASISYLPFEPMIPVLASLLYEIENNFKDSKKSCFEKLENWYWTSVFNNSYSSGVDGQKTSDYREMIGWFKNDTIPKTIDDFRSEIDNLKLIDVSQTTNAMFRGVLSLIALEGAYDLDENRTVLSKIAIKEKKFNVDHIFPKSKYKEYENVESVINKTWLSKDTNQRIKKAIIPSKFITESLETKFESDEKSFLKTLETHLINKEAYDAMKNNSFEKFLLERERWIKSVIGKKIGAPELTMLPTMTTPQTPYTNVRIMAKAINSCKKYLFWIDKYFAEGDLQYIIDALNRKEVSNVKILISILKADEKMRKSFKRVKEEMQANNVDCEMRVVADSKIYGEYHDRWIFSDNVGYNLMSGDIAKRGQYAEIKKTENRPPYEQWWNNSLDIINDWNEIQRRK